MSDISSLILLPQNYNAVIVVSDKLVVINMDVGHGRAVLVDHQLAVLHAQHLPVLPHEAGQVPEDQQTVLTTNDDLTSLHHGAENLQTTDLIRGVLSSLKKRTETEFVPGFGVDVCN